MEILASRVLFRPADYRRSLDFYRDEIGLAIARDYGAGTVFYAGQSLIELAGHGGQERSDPGNVHGGQERSDPGNVHGGQERSDPGNVHGGQERSDPGNVHGGQERSDPGNVHGGQERSDPGNVHGTPAPADPPFPGALWLQVRDVYDTQAELEGRGVEILRAAAQEPWGLHEMQVRDPDGVTLIFVQVPETHPLRRDSRP